MTEFFNIDDKLKKLAEKAQQNAKGRFLEIDEISTYNENKVLKAFIDNYVSETHFVGSTGYGYDDRGREVLDQVFAQSVGAQDALVRYNFVSGTHALTTALFGVLRSGDKMVSLTGKPYDTMEEVIGLRGQGNGSLKDFDIDYSQLDLLEDGTVDLKGIEEAVKGAKVAYIQRSRGYSVRPAISAEKIGEITKLVHKSNKDAIVVVDNCYGEFVQKQEPTSFGADLIVGSLIKNAGGGLAQTGGYIAGKKELVELCAYRLTSPGMGKEVGCTLNQNRSMFMGLHFAPSVTANALKTSAFTIELFSLLGYECSPKKNEDISDIITVLNLKSKEALIAFCQGIQSGSPVDSFVAPEPWGMPGYDSEVIMAAGTFTGGASIELSADAPLKEPYVAYMQGGLTYKSGRMGAVLAAQSMLDKGLLSL